MLYVSWQAKLLKPEQQEKTTSFRRVNYKVGPVEWTEQEMCQVLGFA